MYWQSGPLSLLGAFLVDYDLGAQMLNFAALIAFMGVNAAALMRYYVRAKERKLNNLVPPALGFVICLGIMAEPQPHGYPCGERLDGRGPARLIQTIMTFTPLARSAAATFAEMR